MGAYPAIPAKGPTFAEGASRQHRCQRASRRDPPRPLRPGADIALTILFPLKNLLRHTRSRRWFRICHLPFLDSLSRFVLLNGHADWPTSVFTGLGGVDAEGCRFGRAQPHIAGARALRGRGLAQFRRRVVSGIGAEGAATTGRQPGSGLADTATAAAAVPSTHIPMSRYPAGCRNSAT